MFITLRWVIIMRHWVLKMCLGVENVVLFYRCKWAVVFFLVTTEELRGPIRNNTVNGKPALVPNPTSWVYETYNVDINQGSGDVGKDDNDASEDDVIVGMIFFLFHKNYQLALVNLANLGLIFQKFLLWKGRLPQK